jgi:hypothetical protein
MIMKPFPDIKSRDAFNFVYPVVLRSVTERVGSDTEPKFMKDLSSLLTKDLGIVLDYGKIDRNTRYKTTKKPGFVTDPELYWPIMFEKVKTGKNRVEIYHRVMDSGYGVNPEALSFETFIRVWSGSRLLKEYVISSSADHNVQADEFEEKLLGYLVHVPELMSLGIVRYSIKEESVDDDIKFFRENFLKK